MNENDEIRARRTGEERSEPGGGIQRAMVRVGGEGRAEPHRGPPLRQPPVTQRVGEMRARGKRVVKVIVEDEGLATEDDARVCRGEERREGRGHDEKLPNGRRT